MTSPLDGPAPGRRTATEARRRLDVVAVLAVVLPLLTLLAAYGVHADAAPPAPAGPARTTLDRATVICPSGPAVGDTTSFVATLAGSGSGSGSVGVGSGGAPDEVDVAPHTPATVPAQDGPLVATGLGDLAPGLVAARFGTRPVAVADCRPPQPDQWFTGVGAGAKHDSTLELVNPDAGKALVDVIAYGQSGQIVGAQGDALRGITVAGGDTVRIDLGQTVPRRYDLALHVTTIRGRVAASVADGVDQLGGGLRSADWLPSQSAPTTDNLMLGLPAGSGKRALVLANPGDSEGRATIRLVTPQSVFTPAGVDDIVLPAQSAVRMSLAAILRDAGNDPADRPIGIEIVSTVPATAALLLLVDGDLTHAVPPDPLTSAAVAILPGGTQRLVLGGATGPGVVTASLWDAEGNPLDDVRTAVDAGRGYSVDLPDDAALISLRPQRTPVSATVLVSGDGVAEVPLREPLTTGLVPDVRPGTP